MNNPKGETFYSTTDVSKEDWFLLVKKLNLKPAIMYQTMGPQWKHIHWLVFPNYKRPYYSANK